MARGNGSVAEGATEGAEAESNAISGAGNGQTVELTPEEQAKVEAKKAAQKARRAQRSYIVVPVPANLKQVLQDEANGKDQPIGPYVRDLIAQLKGIEIPVTESTRRMKYASDEERDAARKAKRESRSATMKNLMAEFNRLMKSGMSAEQATAAAATAVAAGTVGESEPVTA